MLSHIPVRVNVVPAETVGTPGSAIAMSVTVYNATSIIDGFKVSVLGINDDNVTTEPDWVSLFPESEQTVSVVVTLPTDFPAGRHHLGIRVTSMTDASIVWVGGIDVVVDERADAEITIDPDSTTATREGRFGLTIQNLGNKPLNFDFAGDDNENHLVYAFDPEALDLPPGDSSSVQLAVSGKRPFTGSPEARQFTISARATELELETAGMITLKPRIPRLALILAGMAAMFALWALVIGAAIDGIVDDTDEDLAAAFEEGIESVVGAVAPEALAADTAGSGGAAGGGDGAGDAVTLLESSVTATVVTASSGEPVVGASATLIGLFDAGSREGTVDPNRDPIVVATDEDGIFATEDTPRGLYDLVIGAPGFIDATCRVLVPFDPASVEACGVTTVAGVEDAPEVLAVALRGLPASVSGLVSLDGDPAGGIAVSIRRLRESDGASIDAGGNEADQFAPAVTTEADGRWTFPIVAEAPAAATPGVFEIEASREGLLTNRIVLTVGAGQSLVGIELPLTVALFGEAEVTGSVEDLDGPLGGVTVTVNGDGVASTGTSLSVAAADRPIGSFSVGLLPVGDFTATFQKEGYVTQSVPFTVAQPTQTVTLATVTLVLIDAPAEAVVTGAVEDAEGPLGAVTVTVSGEGVVASGTSLSVAAAGRPVGSYEISQLPVGDFTATFQKEGYVTQSVPFTVAEQAETVTLATVTLVRSEATTDAVVTGSVEDANGPLGAVIVTVSGEGIVASGTSLSVAAEGRPVGSYEIGELPIGDLTATFQKEGYVTQSVPFTVAERTETVTLATVTLEQAVPTVIGGVVTGTVADVNGTALGGVLVTVTGSGTTLTTTTLTAADPATGRAAGSFALEGVPLGPLTATFERDGFITQAIPFSLDEGMLLAEVNVELVPLFFGTVGGTVTQPDGSALVGATITIEGPDGFTATTTVVNTNGTYSITDLPEGAYVITFSAPTFVTETFDFAVSIAAPDATVSVEMAYEPVPLTGTVLGVAADGSSAGLDAVTVFIDDVAVGTTGATGQFATTPQAIPSTYDLRFERPGYAAATASITANDPGAAALTDTVQMPALVTFTFTLEDESGFAPFPLPFFDEFGEFEPPLEPEVSFSVTGYAEANVDFPVAAPVIGTVDGSTVTVGPLPAYGTIETELLITPVPDSTFVPFDAAPVSASAVITAGMDVDPFVVPFAPGAIYGTRGGCNLQVNELFRDIVLDAGGGQQVEPDLLTDERYLFKGYTSGTYTLSVVEFNEGGPLFFYQQAVELSGFPPALQIDLAEPCTPGAVPLP